LTKLIWAILLTLCAGTVDAQAIRRRPPTYYTGAASTPLAVDDTSAGGMVDWGGSYDLPLTVGTNTNRVLIAGSGTADETVYLDSVVWVVTSPATRQKLTMIAARNHSDPSQDSREEAWALAAPNSGAGNVSYYIHGGNWISAGAMSFYNAKQTSFTDTVTADNTYQNTAPISVTSTTGEIVVDFLCSDGTATWTKDASQTLVGFRQGSYESFGMSYKAHSVTSMTWTTGTSGISTRIAIRVKPL